MDPQRLATHLQEAFPAAPISTLLQVLGEGFGNLVITTANGIVLRIAKHADVLAKVRVAGLSAPKWAAP